MDKHSAGLESSPFADENRTFRVDPEMKRAQSLKTGRFTAWGEQLLHTGNTLGHLLKRSLRTLFSSKVHARIVEGMEKKSEHWLRVAYMGDMSNYYFLLDVLFSSRKREQQRSSRFWWFINRTMRLLEKEVDLVVLDLDFPLSFVISRKGYLNAPRWVKQRIRLSGAWEEVMAQLRRKTRREAQRIIRKHNLRARVVYGRDGAAHFYEQLYRPHIQRRYGCKAHIVDRKRFIHACRHCQIIQLLRGDEILGAEAVRLIKNQISIVWIGIQTHLDETLRRGATDALDYFTLLYAFQRGCRYLNMGGSRPFLNDGVLRYKRKWGAHIYGHKTPQGSFLIRPVALTPAISSMLTHNRFVTLDHRRIVCRMFLPGDPDEKSVREIVENEWVDGLQGIRVFTTTKIYDFSAEKDCRKNLMTFDSPQKFLEHFTAVIRMP